MKSILIIDDEPMILSAMKTTFLTAGYREIETASNGQEALKKLARKHFSLITLDLDLPDISGLDLLLRMEEFQPELPVVVISGSNEVENAVKSLKLGAKDYIVKPVDKTRLLVTVQNIFESTELQNENKRLKESLLNSGLKQTDCFSHIITDDPAVISIFRYIEAISPTSLPVLITGETGTGKELLAKSVHRSSGRTGKFIAVNVAGLDDTLFSDTIFGHVKGAYTGAVSDREGMIFRAAEGTLFLDEVGDLSHESQIKLLRLIQEREYTPLGSDRAIKSKARLVFAANTPLEELVKDKKFRQDLYYRLRSHSMILPPLRKRRRDLPILINEFLYESSVELGKPAPAVAGEITELLRHYSFPGNIRELRGLIYDLVLRYEAGFSIPEYLETQLDVSFPEELQFSIQSFKPLISALSNLPTMKESSDALIDEALERSSGSITDAAALLGLTRSALSKRLSRRR